ncbi:hypothetical protein FYK55_00540 [Roseiconus nitratireducens]|uniref:Squalene cyclase C-terminal domain-containing protein n=1 Tax=Roseiconus nitratireducens TaxID=2605748 RepID=A0A5M6DNE3_9BACT|nr:hypothetical protein [Roseiconus nitratireducens]KAA5546945.1 hypothetical protein FYK55_00540 [Roseiconus nitratireducens]
MTRKSDSTVPHARWRGGAARADDPIARSAQASGAAAPNSVPPEGPPRATASPLPSDQNADAPSSGDSAVDSRPSDAGPKQRRSLFASLDSIRVSSWLASLILHLAVLIALALLTYRLHGNQQGVAIDGALTDHSVESTFQSIADDPQPKRGDGQSTEQPIQVEVIQQSANLATAKAPVPQMTDPVPASLLAELQSGGTTSDSIRQSFLGGGGMSSRTPEGRKKYGDLFGATAESETAVENALRWLAAHQRDDGSWSFDLELSPCDGRCSHGKPKNENTPTPATAATGLAMLAFLGAGYTTESGPYQETVQRGWYYLKSAAIETENGFDWQQSGSMYGHGIAMLAMSELLGMTRRGDDYDSDLLHHVDRGAYFTSIAQHPGGSWGYAPGSPGDTTITGWQVLSLMTARKAGIQMRSDTFDKAKGFLMSVRESPAYAFGYREPEAQPTTTAIALTLLMYLGQTPGNTSFDQAIDKLAADGPTRTNVYHDYYATLALHHWRHRDWDRWNTELRDHLVRTQATEGHEAGSWHFKDRWGDVGGRLYTTAMCTLTLEVYYRFLPLYAKPDHFPL